METEIPENIVPVIPLRGCFLQTGSKLINYFILQNIFKLAKTVINEVKHLSEVEGPALGVGLGSSGDGGLCDGGEEVAGLGGEAERDGDEAAIA